MALLAPLGATAACDVDYRIAVHWDTTPRRFDVTLRIAPSTRTETFLQATPEWAGITDFHRALKDVRGASAATVDAISPGRWKLRHSAGKVVEVAYSAVNDARYPDGPNELDRRDFYRTMIGATFFHVFGHALFVLPEVADGTAPLDVCIEFDGLPREGTFASSIGDGQRGGHARMRGRLALDEVSAMIFVAGDFRVLRREVHGHPLLVAVRGAWSFTDAQFADATAAIVSAHREFWEDFDFPRYLLTLIPNRKPQGSTGGTAVRDAFAMHASNDFIVPGPAFEYLIAHEHLHTWVPRRMGGLGRQDEAQRYWLSEGFTNYLSHRLLVRAGFWTLDDYVRNLNGVGLEYANSPAASADNERVARDFWGDPDVQRIPYLRGELLALLWARRLEAKGDSLEATLRGLRLPRGRDTQVNAVDRLRETLHGKLGAIADDDIAVYVTRGDAFPMDAGLLGPCFTATRERKPRFELGFSRAGSKDWVVRGVVPGSAAEKAGLRDGMKMDGYSVRFGDTTREASVKVRDGEAVRTIAYVPVAAEPMEVMVFAVKPAAGANPACRSWMER